MTDPAGNAFLSRHFIVISLDSLRLAEFLRCTDYTMKEYKDCLLDIFLVTNNGTGCRDILGEPFIPQVPYCDVHNITIEVQVFEAEEEEILGLTFDFRDMSATHQILLHFVREGLHGKDGQCFIPCKTNTYETEHLPLHYFGKVSSSHISSTTRTSSVSLHCYR